MNIRFIIIFTFENGIYKVMMLVWVINIINLILNLCE